MANKYREFFRETPEGVALLKKLESERIAKYQKAESSPELARDFVQRAAGVRDAINLINGLMTDSKKPGREPAD